MLFQGEIQNFFYHDGDRALEEVGVSALVVGKLTAQLIRINPKDWLIGEQFQKLNGSLCLPAPGEPDMKTDTGSCSAGYRSVQVSFLAIAFLLAFANAMALFHSCCSSTVKTIFLSFQAGRLGEESRREW
ncbi:hypothetical protein [Pseudomonas sp. C5pp]|uniref:hypothetical protein n=1 Tax=Pseudomonas sp. C5pp TaxID=1586081 RepID=UPI002E80D557|nr:hypothetical protein [Pseudomonas sp. C5pp]